MVASLWREAVDRPQGELAVEVCVASNYQVVVIRGICAADFDHQLSADLLVVGSINGDRPRGEAGRDGAPVDEIKPRESAKAAYDTVGLDNDFVRVDGAS